MPGFDGTGPMGMGPMTGGGRGFCVSPLGVMRPRSAYGMGYIPYPAHGGYPIHRGPFAGALFGAGRGGFPYGGGRGRVFGGGRGFRRWW